MILGLILSYFGAVAAHLLVKAVPHFRINGDQDNPASFPEHPSIKLVGYEPNTGQ